MKNKTYYEKLDKFILLIFILEVRTSYVYFIFFSIISISIHIYLFIIKYIYFYKLGQKIGILKYHKYMKSISLRIHVVVSM